MNDYVNANHKRLSDNVKLIEACKLLGLEATYFSGMYTLRHKGEYIGQMTAEAWLDHMRDALISTKRS